MSLLLSHYHYYDLMGPLLVIRIIFKCPDDAIAVLRLQTDYFSKVIFF